MLQSLQYVITLLIIATSAYCAVWRSELYPFAPYTMYSHKHNIVNHDFFDIHCSVDGKKVVLTNRMLWPLDEARLEMSVSESYYKKEYGLIVSKLTSVKEQVLNNKFECEKVQFDVLRYKGPEEMLSKQGASIHTEVSL